MSCKHEHKVYTGWALTSGTPQWEWLCLECGASGYTQQEECPRPCVCKAVLASLAELHRVLDGKRA